MISVVRLMHVAEDGKPYFPRYLDALEKFVAIVESDGVQPLAAHRYGRMMQADHDVVRARGRDFTIEASEFAGRQVPASVPADATVNTYNKPVTGFNGFAVMKWRCAQRLTHQCANVVVTGHAVYRRADRTKDFAEMVVRAAAIVMNQVTGHDDEVGAPVAIMIVIEHRT